jgi:predicted RND superfamily exporter protein
LFTAVLALGIPRLRMRPFFEGDLPANDPILRANEVYSAHFGKDEVAYLALVSDTIYHPSTLAKVVAITDDLNMLDDVREEETLSLATVRRVQWGEGTLDVRRYLSSLPQTSAEVARLRQDIRLDDEVYGKLVSTDESSTLFAIKLNQGYDPHQLYLSLHAVADKYSGPERIYPFGHQVLNEETDLGIGHDARILGPTALLLMATGIFYFFRSFRLTLGAVLMVAMSIVWTMGMMHYLGFRLSILSPSIPAVLIALGSSYMIHVIYSCGEEAGGVDIVGVVTEGLRKIGPPIMLAVGTSMVGFATLVVFKILSIREFGICVALGVGICGVLSLVVLPSAMILQKGIFTGSGRRGFDLLDRALGGLAHIGLTYKYAVLALGVLLGVTSMVGISRMKVGFAPGEMFPRDHRAREVISLFLDKFHGHYSINAMFVTEEPDGIKEPEMLKQIEAFQKFAEEVPRVKYSVSIINIIKRMNRILNEDNPEFYRVPDSKAMVAQLLLVNSLTQDPIQFESLVDYDLQRCKVTITTTATDSMELEEIYRLLTTYCEDNVSGGLTVHFGGRSLVWIAQNQYIIIGKIINIIANVLLIWAICAVAFRSVRLGLVSVIPLSMATLATFGLMGHFGIRLDTATAVLTGISVGVGVDFAIHFISRLKRESLLTGRMDQAVGATMIGAGRAIVFDATSNVLGFVTFMFSGFAPVRTLGVLVCFTMVSCLVLTLLLVPAIIALIPVPFRHAEEGTIFLDTGPHVEEAIFNSEAAE